MLSNRNKIISISIFFVFALVVGIYLYADDGAVVVDANRHTPQEESPDPSEPRSEESLSMTPSPVPQTADTAATSADATASRDANPYVFYPETILELLNVDMEKMIAERGAFKNTIVHVEWMDRVDEILKTLDPEKKAAIIENHTTLLYLKDLLNKAYLTGEMDHDTFTRALADLMKWHQKTFESMLTDAEYEALFELKPEMAEDMIDDLIDASPRYGFVLNQKIPPEEVTKQVQGYKLEEVDSHFKKMIYDRDQIGKKINAGEITLEQAREALFKSQQAFIARCKQLLTDEEIDTLFGSVEALETGQAQTEPPAVLGDSDLTKLGFKIENPNTNIETVEEKLDEEKITDVKFFYQQRAEEREELIDQLNAGEIEEADLENISRDMDAAFEENCRSVLTDEEYQMLFNKESPVETEPADDEDIPASEDIRETGMEEPETAAEQTLEKTEAKEKK